MAPSASCRFFLTPEEVVDVIEGLTESSDLHLFVQLRRPGVVVERLEAASAILARSEKPPRLLLTHRDLPPGLEPATFDGSGVGGLVLVSMPFVEGERFFLGSAGAKFVDEQDLDASIAKALVRQLKRRASLKLWARNIKSGDGGPASGLGCSDAAWKLATSLGLQLRQFAVENIEYRPFDLEQP